MTQRELFAVANQRRRRRSSTTTAPPDGGLPNLPGLAAHYDASDLATITATAGKVSQWGDKSSFARHLTQPTAGLQPQTGIRTVNGLNVIDFVTGTERLNATPFMSGTTAATILCVFAYDTGGLVASGGGPFSDWGTSGLDNLWTYDDDHVYIDWGQTTRPNCGLYTTNEPRQVSVVTAANDWRVYISGSVFFSTATNTVAWGTAPGVGSQPSKGWNGAIAEIVIYSRALSDSERVTVQNYLNMKWGTP
jgi:hypothetical protein